MAAAAAQEIGGADDQGAGTLTPAAGRVQDRFCDTDSMICAVMISARCENACGKLPIWRCSLGSYSSDSRPRWLRSDSSRSNSASASSSRPGERVVVGQPEAARQERALGSRQPVGAAVGLVAEHEAVAQQVLLDRRDRALHARIAARAGSRSAASPARSRRASSLPYDCVNAPTRGLKPRSQTSAWIRSAQRADRCGSMPRPSSPPSAELVDARARRDRWRPRPSPSSA